ncbi:MAG: DUF687 family protein, partial [Chlamydiia bacterium]|nr:DUF687 family protein [Chlamydiia bacterium]
FSPWQHCGKRFDPATSLLHFPKRVYDPSICRWMTPDPFRFEDGLNLYAYVHNNPLLYVDPYGLFGTSFFHALKEFGFGAQRSRVNGITFYDDFEKGCANQSRTYDLSHEKDFKPLSRGRILFINGIDTSFKCAQNHARYIGRLAGGYQVHGVYNATHGKFADAIEYLRNRNYCATPPVRLLHHQWNAFFSRSDPEVPLLQICHSQGAVLVRNALMCYPQELRKRIVVAAVAPGAYIDKHLCKEVTHYVTKWNRDVVPCLDFRGRIGNRRHVVALKPHKHSPWFDHDFQSPTYKGAMSKEIQKYFDDIN